MSQTRPYVNFAEVKEKISIMDAMEVFGIADRFQWKGKTLVGCCPLPAHPHGPEPNAEQFKVDIKNGRSVFFCFGDCKAGGSVIDFCMAMTGLDEAHIRFWFASKFGDRLSTGKRNGQVAEKKDTACTANGELAAQTESLSKTTVPTPQAQLKPLRFFLRLDPDVEYLRQRNVTAETIVRYGLGLCHKGMMAGYIAMPLHDPHHPDSLVGYLGRWPGEDHNEQDRPRYKLPKDFPKSQVIFGLREALQSNDKRPLIVVEGAFGVFALVQAGYAAVAILGSSLSDEQAAILAGTGRPIILMFDGDQAGQNGMKAATDKLIPRCFVRSVQLEEELQPDSLATEHLAGALSFLS